MKSKTIGFLFLLFSFLFPAYLLANPKFHEVIKGDTLYSLSRKYKISVDELTRLNKIENNNIKIGQRLLIGAPTTVTPSTSTPQTQKTADGPKENGWVRYEITKGDTLYSLARKYEVTVDKLMKENNLSEAGVIKMGQILYVPSPTLALLDDSPTKPSTKPSTPSTKPDKITWIDPKIDVKGETLKANSLLWPAKGKLLRREGKVEGVLIESELGSPVVSICSGTVVWANSFRGYQKMVVVQAPSGYNYTYCGNESLLVKVGDKVSVGTQIGTVGYASFDDATPNLLLITYKGEKWIDPMLAPRK